MIRFWVLGLIIAAVAAIYLVRLVLRARKASIAPEPVDLPLWDGDVQQTLDSAAGDADEDTAPAVLSPPEWKPPKSVNRRNS